MPSTNSRPCFSQCCAAPRKLRACRRRVYKCAVLCRAVLLGSPEADQHLCVCSDHATIPCSQFTPPPTRLGSMHSVHAVVCRLRHAGVAPLRSDARPATQTEVVPTRARSRAPPGVPRRALRLDETRCMTRRACRAGRAAPGAPSG